jgi:hypothetical protein
VPSAFGTAVPRRGALNMTSGVNCELLVYAALASVVDKHATSKSGLLIVSNIAFAVFETGNGKLMGRGVVSAVAWANAELIYVCHDGHRH